MQAGEIATACHLIGKRWALQVVRELALGPWRFTDLHHRVQGISTNVLAARLRELQQANVVRRRLLPPPASSMVYELTEGGRQLGRIVLELEQWATDHSRPPLRTRRNAPGAKESRTMSAGDASASGSNGGEPFVCLAEALLGETRVSRSDGPGRASLRVEGRVFATDLEGWLVLRLPAARADALVASGLAQRLDPGHDSLLLEWVAVAPTAKERWIALAREARDFVRARYRNVMRAKEPTEGKTLLHPLGGAQA
jgi:DNA-binding HxlR family transcriptional regulator